MDNDEPRTISQILEGKDLTRPSTWSSPPSAKCKPSAKVRGLIGRLGLRYHPANSADLGAHQAMLAMLADDVAHIPPDALERAIRTRWLLAGAPEQAVQERRWL